MNALSLLTILALTQSPPLDLRKLDQISDLAGPRRPAAETALLADPKSAGALLSFAVRTSGPHVLQDVVREKLQCPMMLAGGPYRLESGPGKPAAALLITLAGTNEAVRQQLATSGYGLDKLIAVISVWNDEEALKKLAGQLEAPAFDDTERRALASLRQCAVMQMMKAGGLRNGARTAALEKLAQTATKRSSCDDAKGGEALVAAGPLQLRGWSASATEFAFHVEANGVATDASPACLLATYEPLHASGDGSFVLVPLVESHSPLEKDALALMQRDLDSYPKDARRAALKLLLSRGLVPEKFSEFTDVDRRNEPALLRPWLASGDPQAQGFLLSKLACPSSGDDVPTLVALKDRKVAVAEAHRLGATCPRSRGAAMTVLHELKDPKWLKYAPLLMDDPFARGDFERELTKAWSPAVKEQLLAISSKDPAFLTWRQEWIVRSDRDAR